MKTSKEALLEMCTPIDDVRASFLKSLADGMKEWDPKIREEAMSVLNDKPKANNDIYLIGQFYIHNPPESWRDYRIQYISRSNEWYQGKINPIEGLQDLKDSAIRNVFLYGFTVKDIVEVHLPGSEVTVYPDATPYDSSYYPDYSKPDIHWSPDRDDLLLILEKNDRIPCWVSDLRNIPDEWKKLVGHRVQFFTTFRNDSKPSSMPDKMWEKQIPGEVYLKLFNFGPYNGATTPQINPINLIKIVD